MPRLVPGRRSITTIFTEKEYEDIKVLAARNKTSMNEVLRQYVINGLNGTLTEQNLDIIIPIIRDQLKSIIKPFEDRLASMTSKTCIQAGAAAYLSAEALACLVPVELQHDLAEAYERARKRAVVYMKNNIETD